MKSKLIFVLLFLILSVRHTSAQEEFFREKNGLTLGGTSNFLSIIGGNASFLLKKNTIISGSFLSDFFDDRAYGLSINQFITDRTVDSPTKGIIGLSLSLYDEDTMLSFNFGVLQSFLHKTNFPLSLGLNTNLSFHNGLGFQPELCYNQAFLSNKRIYPVVGVTYLIPMNKRYNQIEYTLFFHVGLNIRLQKS